MTVAHFRAARCAVLAVALVGALGFGGCAKRGDDPLTLTFETEKSCVRKGEEQTIVTSTDDGVEIAYAVTYADGRFHGVAPRGYTDDDGVFRATWVIPLDVPAGRVSVRILGADGPRTDSVVAPFHVTDEQVPCP